ncbi:MAG: ATP-binding cassette domain-containing protein, partial [Pseudomonadota bacterium]|nr:ATP-binding cassette domain-containing protein [Pseudomonadota bacterium]
MTAAASPCDTDPRDSLPSQAPAPGPARLLPAATDQSPIAAVPASTAAPVVAELRAAVRRFGNVVALDGVDLQIHAGEVLAVLGCNGAGKTTALGLLTGRLKADAGQCLLFGRDPRDAVARRAIGVMLQEAALPETLRVGELVH